MLPAQAFTQVRLRATSIGGSTPLGGARHIENARRMDREPVLMLLRNFAMTGAGHRGGRQGHWLSCFRQQGTEWARVNANSPPNCHPGAQPPIRRSVARREPISA